MRKLATTLGAPWMGLVALTAVGCQGTVITQSAACDPTVNQPCGGGGGGGAGSGTGAGGGGGANGGGSGWSGTHLARRYGDASRQWPRSVAVDGSDNILLIGDMDGAIDFGGGPIGEPETWRDVFVAKLDPKLNHLQSKIFGNPSSAEGRGIGADKAGNVLLTGAFDGTIDFGGGPLEYGGLGLNLYVAKLDPQLGHLASKRFGEKAQSIGYSIVADAGGDVITTGYFDGSLDLGGGPLQSPGPYEDVFLAKFDPALGHLYSKCFGDEGRQYASEAVVDSAGNIVVAGQFTDTVDFGGGLLTSAGDIDIFVAKLDPQLHHLHSKGFGDPEVQLVTRLAVDSAGNIVVTGYFRGTVDFGGGPLVSAGDIDVFVAKFDSQLQHIASRRFGVAGAEMPFGVAVDASGNVVLVGSFVESIDFGGGPLVSVGDLDVFVAKLDPQLQHIWSKRFGGELDQEATGVAADGAGNIVVIGAFAGTIDFGDGPLVSAGDFDVFVATLPP